MVRHVELYFYIKRDVAIHRVDWKIYMIVSYTHKKLNLLPPNVSHIPDPQVDEDIILSPEEN